MSLTIDIYYRYLNYMDGVSREWFKRKRYGTAPNRYSALQVYEKSNGICGICGEVIDPSLRWPNPLCFVTDHIKSRNGFGGPDSLENSQAAHRICNYRKGGKEDRDHSKLRGKKTLRSEGERKFMLVRVPQAVSYSLDEASALSGHSANSIVNSIVADYLSTNTVSQIAQHHASYSSTVAALSDARTSPGHSVNVQAVNDVVQRYPQTLASLRDRYDETITKLSGAPEAEEDH